ncbi:hypothetical protein CSV77_03595 [Sporosarcina sp. P16b]|uniref:hypothetical protein n=1 Tax=Sporosarcina sp. P16b TaxID=2048261 RepID=UPI000C170BCC|nr:hypothetical protein [Sporosarcina sp. P16b]PIC71135.1 hypothetical protein CSV77_03595 [Sporosarcina sp. P16b]
MNELLSNESFKTIIPILVGVTSLITAIITFMLTSIFTVIRDKKKINFDNRAYFEYGEHEMYFPIKQESIDTHGDGLVLFGKNGAQFKNEAGKRDRFCTFMIVHNRTNNDLLNVKIKTIYSGRNRIEEEFVLPYWKSNDAIYLFQTDYNGSSHFSTNEHLSIEFTTRSLERLKFMFKRQQNKNYIERYQKRFYKFFWINLINYRHSDFFSFQKLKKR